ncbi:FidL-like protein [Pantoea sp. 1.19]|uniref:FidL-like protein n=1 Tax=Pantoea sp. 1.19 TaxID=1925589 RepID=UPI000948A27D|nr:FidL-like protein [Pantoea sp. 1.19]
MKKRLTVAILMLVVLALALIAAKRWWPRHTSSQWNEHCTAEMQMQFDTPAGKAGMNGDITITTLDNTTISFYFNGLITQNEQSWAVNRTHMFTYRYFADNQTLELRHRSMSKSLSDTIPDEQFYKMMIRSDVLILRVKPLSDHAMLYSGLSTPLYICMRR